MMVLTHFFPYQYVFYYCCIINNLLFLEKNVILFIITYYFWLFIWDIPQKILPLQPNVLIKALQN